MTLHHLHPARIPRVRYELLCVSQWYTSFDSRGSDPSGRHREKKGRTRKIADRDEGPRNTNSHRGKYDANKKRRLVETPSTFPFLHCITTTDQRSKIIKSSLPHPSTCIQRASLASKNALPNPEVDVLGAVLLQPTSTPSTLCYFIACNLHDPP